MVCSTVGDRGVSSDAEEWMSDRGPAVGKREEFEGVPGDRHGGGVAGVSVDEAGARDAARLVRRLFAGRRMAGAVCVWEASPAAGGPGRGVGGGNDVCT